MTNEFIFKASKKFSKVILDNFAAEGTGNYHRCIHKPSLTQQKKIIAAVSSQHSGKKKVTMQVIWGPGSTAHRF